MKALLVCSCPKMDEFAEEAYEMLFHSEAHVIYVGKSKIMDFANTLTGDAREYVSAIARNKDKFAYYVDTESDSINEVYNLKSGARVA